MHAFTREPTTLALFIQPETCANIRAHQKVMRGIHCRDFCLRQSCERLIADQTDSGGGSVAAVDQVLQVCDQNDLSATKFTACAKIKPV
jgi:hypothetical protein